MRVGTKSLSPAGLAIPALLKTCQWLPLSSRWKLNSELSTCYQFSPRGKRAETAVMRLCQVDACQSGVRGPPLLAGSLIHGCECPSEQQHSWPFSPPYFIRGYGLYTMETPEPQAYTTPHPRLQSSSSVTNDVLALHLGIPIKLL